MSFRSDEKDIIWCEGCGQGFHISEEVQEMLEGDQRGIRSFIVGQGKGCCNDMLLYWNMSDKEDRTKPIIYIEKEKKVYKNIRCDNCDSRFSIDVDVCEAPGMGEYLRTLASMMDCCNNPLIFNCVDGRFNSPKYKDITEFIKNGGKKVEELKVSKERVLEVAKTCPDVDRVMRGLFPEVFEKKPERGDIYTDGDDYYIVTRIAPGKLNLISIDGWDAGNRWNDDYLFGNNPDRFTYVCKGSELHITVKK